MWLKSGQIPANEAVVIIPEALHFLEGPGSNFQTFQEKKKH